MLKTKFIPTILVIVLGVNLGAWTLSVATSPNRSSPSISIPIGSPAIDAQAQSASVAVTMVPPDAAANVTIVPATTAAASSTQSVSEASSSVSIAPQAKPTPAQ